MAQIAKNVTTSKPKATGAVWKAPIGTDLPTTSSAALDDAFVSLGYMGEDGIKENIEKDKQDFKAFGGDIVLTQTTTHKLTYAFTPYEHMNAEALKVLYGDKNVIVGADGEITVKINSDSEMSASWIIEIVLSDGRVQRTVIPNGKVSAEGEDVFADGSAIGREVTVTAFPDELGNKAYTYIAKPLSA